MKVDMRLMLEMAVIGRAPSGADTTLDDSTLRESNRSVDGRQMSNRTEYQMND